MNVQFKNPKTGELKTVKVGWSWVLFLFSSFIGIPLFWRGLYIWGGIMAGIWVLNFIFTTPVAILSDPTAFIILILIQIGLSIFFGIKGNEMTAKNYLEKGWELVNLDSDIVKMAKEKWVIVN